MEGGRASRVVVAAALAVCGCSLVAVRRPPPSLPPPGAPLECTQSRVAPVVDTVGAIATPVVGAGAWVFCVFLQSQQSWATNPRDLSCGTIFWTTLGVTAAFTGAAVYGFRETGACERLAGQRVERERSSTPLPPSLAPTPRSTRSDQP